METKIVKVLLADDSVVMRLLISDILKKNKDIELVDVATNGMEACEKTMKLKPDVVILDMNMGEYDGIYATKRIMSESPTPILILSSIGNSDMKPILEALESGAADYMNKPENNTTGLREVEDTLFQKIKAVSEVQTKTLLPAEQVILNTELHSFDSELFYEIIAVGASTGGPTAVEKLITKLPANLAVPVIIVQHMPPNFVPSFVNRLNMLTPLEVILGRKDEEVTAGKIIIAPGSRNMIVRRDNSGKILIDFTSKRYKEYNHQSINGLLESVAEVYANKAIGVILTGMGKDGADGLEKIYNEGGYTIAQSKETCVVYGMPREVVERNVVKQSVSINEMGGFLVSCLS